MFLFSVSTAHLHTRLFSPHRVFCQSQGVPLPSYLIIFCWLLTFTRTNTNSKEVARKQSVQSSFCQVEEWVVNRKRTGEGHTHGVVATVNTYAYVLPCSLHAVYLLPPARLRFNFPSPGFPSGLRRCYLALTATCCFSYYLSKPCGLRSRSRRSRLHALYCAQFRA